MECAEDAIFVSDNAGRYLYANPAALKMTGYSLQELCALTIGELVAEADHPRLPEHLDATRRGERRLLEWRMRRKDGSVLLAEFNTLQLPDGRFLAIGRDVSRRKQTEDKLRLAAQVFEQAREGIVITDANGTMIEVNQAFCRLTGYSKEELVGNNPRMLHSGHQAPQFYRELWNTVVQTGAWQGEIWDRKKDGELFVTRVSIAAVLDASGVSKHYIGFFSDVTARRREQEKIEGLAYYDALTGLPNRVLLADRMQQALLAAQRQSAMLAVCCLDLNEFKPINDRYGHMAGDEVLATVARRLQVSTRTQDSVARLGGDEFALLLTALHSAEEAESVLTRVLHAVAQPCQLSNGTSVTVTASLGVALYPDVGRDADTLMLHADQAMYLAKCKGKSQLHFYTPATDA
jgi:diguanylate cyclase (GGDEF)-like protein/PAS domain S-box-containing protein